MPNKSIVSTFRNSNVVLPPNFAANPYQSMLTAAVAAINPNFPVYHFGGADVGGIMEEHSGLMPAQRGTERSMIMSGSKLDRADREHMEMTTFPAIVYQTKLSKLNVGGVVDILHQVDELRPCLEQIIPLLKENGISGKVLRHCDLKELKNVSVCYYFLAVRNNSNSYLFLGPKFDVRSVGDLPVVDRNHAQC